MAHFCTNVVRSKNGNISTLHQDLVQFFKEKGIGSKDVKSTAIRYYKLATDKAFLDLVGSRAEFDSETGEITFDSFMNIIKKEPGMGIDKLDVLTYLNSKLSEELPYEEAVAKIESYNAEHTRVDSDYMLSLQVTDKNSTSKVKVVAVLNTENNRKILKEITSNIGAIKVVEQELESLGASTEFLDAAFDSNDSNVTTSRVEQILNGLRTVIKLSSKYKNYSSIDRELHADKKKKTGISKNISEKDYSDAGYLVAQSFSNNPIIKRLYNTISQLQRYFPEDLSKYFSTDVSSLDTDDLVAAFITDAFKEFNHGKFNSLASRVRETIYKIFSKVSWDEVQSDLYNVRASAERMARSVYSANIPISKLKDLGIKYSVQHSTLTLAQQTIGNTLARLSELSNKIAKNNTAAYNKLYSDFSGTKNFSDGELEALQDMECYTIIESLIGSIVDDFVTTYNELSDYMKLPAEEFNDPNSTVQLHAASKILHCQDVLEKMNLLKTYYSQVAKQLAEDSEEGKQLSKIISQCNEILNMGGTGIVSQLLEWQRMIVTDWFSEFLGNKDVIVIPARWYFHKKFMPIYQKAQVVKVEDIVSKYLSKDNATHWLRSLIDSKDLGMNILESGARRIKYAEGKVNEGYFMELQHIKDLMKEYGLNTSDQSYFFEKDSNGIITGNFISETWFGEFARQKEIHRKEAVDRFIQHNIDNSITYNSVEEEKEALYEFLKNDEEYNDWLDSCYSDEEHKHLDLNKFTNPEYLKLSDEQKVILNRIRELKKDIEDHCLTDLDGTRHFNRSYVPQFSKKSNLSLSSSALYVGNDLASFVSTAEDDSFGSPAFSKTTDDYVTEFDLELNRESKLLLYGINKLSKPEDLNTNLLNSMGRYALMASRYKTAKDIALLGYSAINTLKQREDVSANEQVFRYDNKVNSDPESSYDVYDVFVRKYIEDDPRTSLWKFISQVIGYVSVSVLGLNPLSAIKNKISGDLFTLKDAMAGISPFTTKELLSAKLSTLMQYIPMTVDTIRSTNYKFKSRNMALLDFVGALHANQGRLSEFNSTNKRIISSTFRGAINFSMLMMSLGDNSIMANSYKAALKHIKVWNINSGKRTTLYDCLRFDKKNGRYQFNGQVIKDVRHFEEANTIKKLLKLITDISEYNYEVTQRRENLKSQLEHGEISQDEYNDLIKGSEYAYSDYMNSSKVLPYINTLSRLSLDINFMKDGNILSEEEAIKLLTNKLKEYLVTEDDIFKAIYNNDKFAIVDQGNYNKQDAVKAMTTQYVAAITNFQAWLFGTMNFMLYNNINVNKSGSLVVAKTERELELEYKNSIFSSRDNPEYMTFEDFCKKFNYSEEDSSAMNEYEDSNYSKGYNDFYVSFEEYKKEYAELKREYDELSDTTGDVTVSKGAILTLWQAITTIISAIFNYSEISNIYSENIEKEASNYFGMTLDAESAKEFEDKLKNFSTGKYVARVIAIYALPFVFNNNTECKKYMLRCGWTPDDISKLAFLGMAQWFAFVGKAIIRMLSPGNESTVGKTNSKIGMVATKVFKRKALKEPGKIFKLYMAPDKDAMAAYDKLVRKYNYKQSFKKDRPEKFLIAMYDGKKEIIYDGEGVPLKKEYRKVFPYIKVTDDKFNKDVTRYTKDENGNYIESENGEYVRNPEYDNYFENKILQNTMYNKKDPYYTVMGFITYLMYMVSSEQDVKRNIPATVNAIQDFGKMDLIALKRSEDLLNTAKTIIEDPTNVKAISTSALNNLLHRCFLSLDEYGRIRSVYQDSNTGEMKSGIEKRRVIDENGNETLVNVEETHTFTTTPPLRRDSTYTTPKYIYDHEGIHWQDGYDKLEKVKNFKRK